MNHDSNKYLADMLEACAFIIELTRAKTVEDYYRDRVFRSALQRELQNIGEALRQLRTRDPATAGSIPDSERIIRFRHVLVHGYDSLRAEVVWDVVEFKLPVLKEALLALLGQRGK